MGKINLFFGWLTLLGVSLYCAYLTNQLRDAGRQQVARVMKVSGQVFQRPEVLSVFELVFEKDQLFRGDYITTGAGASAEIELINSKTLVIGENSLVQLSFDSVDEGSDIVTLLKGDVIARSREATGKNLVINVGDSTVQNIGPDSRVRITKRVDQIEATVTMVSGSAQVVGENQIVQDLKLNQEVKVVADSPSALVDSPINLAGLSVPIISSTIEKIIRDDVRETFASPPVTVPRLTEKPVITDIKNTEVEKPKTPAKVKVASRIAAVAPNAPAISKPVPPYQVVFLTVVPTAFVGNGIYIVKDHRLFAKVTGQPTPKHLLGIMKKFKGDLLFRGEAAALLGGVETGSFDKRKTVFAANKDGIQKVDATLVRSRSIAFDLLKKGDYTIFSEPVNLLNVGH